MGGLFVRTDRLVEVGSELFVDLVKPGWKRQLTLNARVTSRVDALDGRLSKRMPGMGIKFLRLDEKQHDRLRSLLREMGAPEEDLKVTLADEQSEEELRALELDTSSPAEPLDPQPQPVWQQVQLVEAAHPAHSLVDDIEGALREANLPPPGPVVIADPTPPPKPAPPPRIPTPASLAPVAVPHPRIPTPISLTPVAVQSAGPSSADASAEARLMLQIRGLVVQLSDTQQQLSKRDAEIERLREELDTIRGALERAVRRT